MLPMYLPTQAAHVEATKVLANHVGMFVVLGLTASLPKADDAKSKAA